MSFQLPDEGAASAELARQTHAWWLAAAEKAEIDVTGFDPDAPLNEQITWALGQGLEIGAVYSRFSSKRHHGNGDQVRTCVEHAASKGIFCLPEYVCVVEAQVGVPVDRE